LFIGNALLFLIIHRAPTRLRTRTEPHVYTGLIRT